MISPKLRAESRETTFLQKAVLLHQIRIMEFDKDLITGLEIEYDSGSIPPPFSNVYRLVLDWSTEVLIAELILHYTDREDLSEQEILDEGFTLEDDYSATLTLDAAWKHPVFQLLKATKWNSKQLKDEGISLALIEKDQKDSKPKIPLDQEGWKLMGQDLIQAIYETNKKEAPLQIQFRIVDSDQTKDAKITVHFSNRKVIFQSNGIERELNWEYAIQLMKLIFMPDYNYEIAKEEAGKKRGIYLECGDGFWHELGKGVTNIDSDYDAVSKMREGIVALLKD